MEAENKKEDPDAKKGRYFVDLRAGCGAVRDSQHPKYDPTYQGLHHDTPDVVLYAHGYKDKELGTWSLSGWDVARLKSKCNNLNLVEKSRKVASGTTKGELAKLQRLSKKVYQNQLKVSQELGDLAARINDITGFDDGVVCHLQGDGLGYTLEGLTDYVIVDHLFEEMSKGLEITRDWIYNNLNI